MNQITTNANANANTNAKQLSGGSGSGSGGTIALLNLPANTVLSLNASASQTLQNEEPLLVISNIRPSYGCHLLVVRGGCNSNGSNSNSNSNGNGNGNNNNNSINGSMLHSIGILILYPPPPSSSPSSNNNSNNNNDDCNWFVAKKFDAQTEEISSQQLDQVSYNNLRKSIIATTTTTTTTTNNNGSNSNSINRSRIIPYDRLFLSSSTSTTSTSTSNHSDIWSQCLTNFISINVLLKHGLSGSGDKIVPGTFSEDGDNMNVNVNVNVNVNNSNNNNNNRDDKTGTVERRDIRNNNSHDNDNNNNTNEDGYSLSYPPIPHLNDGNDNDNDNNNDNHSTSIHSHQGTRRFLATLTPMERTAIFLYHTTSTSTTNTTTAVASNPSQEEPNKNEILFEKVMNSYYDGCWKLLLGEFQLSFIIFLCCSCLSSFEHWRDTIQMISLLRPMTLKLESEFLESFLIILKYQLFSFDNGMFNDEEILDGNFLLPAVKRLCYQCINQTQNIHLQTRAKELLQEFSSRVPDFTYNDNVNIKHDNNEDKDMKDDNVNNYNEDDGDDDDDDDDEDGPTIVSMDEITASIGRSSKASKSLDCTNDNDTTHSIEHMSKYPFLFASVIDGEDIIMTCARILDEKPDVTSVREAAAYLEEVEASSINQSYA